MSYRLAIAISGAVSLGSYESGVMFEIIRAIGEHNKNIQDANNRIEIDVVTGASAGGMTAAILAQKLMFESDALAKPDGSGANDLYEAWVEIADIQGMLQPDAEEQDYSILSSTFVAGIAQRFLLDRYKGTPAAQEPHPAAAERIHLGMAMSNLNGVDYSLPAFDGSELSEPDSKFTYTRFQDRRTRTISKDDDNKEFWEGIAIAARASGAFPFAFRPLYVKREPTEDAYHDPAIDSSAFPHQAFTYTDGGVFNNSPLGVAKMLAEKEDTDPRDYERRFYLYVSPERKGSTANKDLTEEKAKMLTFGKALAQDIFQQGRFQDWVTTAQYNDLIDQFDERATRLRDLMGRINKTKLKSMASVADLLLDHIYEIRKEGEPSRKDDFDRLMTQFMVDKPAQELLANKGDQVVEAWIKSVQVLEQSGRLGSKDKMRIYTVTASDNELAGDFDVAFAGFFDRRFRDFDYAMGRKKARVFLQNLKAMNGSNDNLPLTGFDFPDELPTMDSKLANATIKDVSPDIRKDLKERFYDRAERLLEQAGLKGFFRSILRKLIMWFFVCPELKKYLKL